jgi:hypothetical protein
MAIVPQMMLQPGGHQYGHRAFQNVTTPMLDPDVKRQAEAAELAPRLQQQRFNTVFPWLQNQLGSAMAGSTTPGGSSGPSPEITVGPMWNPQQIQQQVNASRAANDQALGGQMNRIQSKVGASGFGSNSPLAMALQNQAANANRAMNTANEREARMRATEANANQIFKTQMGREQQFAARQAEDIERRKPYFNTVNSLLSAISGLV